MKRFTIFYGDTILHESDEWIKVNTLPHHAYIRADRPGSNCSVWYRVIKTGANYDQSTHSIQVNARDLPAEIRTIMLLLGEPV